MNANKDLGVTRFPLLKESFSRALREVSACWREPGATSEQAGIYLARQFQSMVAQLPLSVMGNLFTSMAIAYIFRGQADHGILAAWLMVVWTFAACSLYMWWRCRDLPKTTPASLPLVWLLAVIIVASGVAYAWVALYLFGVSDANGRMVMTMIITAFVCTGGWLFAVLPQIGLAWVLILTVGAITAFRTQSEAVYQYLIVLLSFCSVTICSSILLTSRLFLDGLKNELEIERQKDLVALLLTDFEQRASDWLWETDREGNLTHAPLRLAEAMETPAVQLKGLSLVTIISSRLPDAGPDQQIHFRKLESCLAQDRPFYDVAVPTSLGGQIRWWSLTAKPLLDVAGQVRGWRGVGSDITERKAAEDHIRYLAHYDTLTGVPNRFNLDIRLEQALLSANRESTHVAVMFIDLDRFKVINDTLGHHIGDALLVEVARRLRTVVRESDIIGRLGGDEFVVVLTSLGESADAAPVANKIQRVLGEPYAVENNLLYSTHSIGIAVYPSDGRDGASLMRNADTAMYHAKEQGRNNAQFYTPAMNIAASERLSLERDLRVALKNDQLEVHYQPKFRIADGKVCGVEALVRWNHPQHGMVPPLKFIPVAEDCGLIDAVGLYVLDEACRQLAAWRTEGFDDMRMSVNLAAHQLRSEGLVHSVHAAMARYDLKQGDLELEVTESAAMANPDRAIGQLRALRQLGVRLAIDDFGTGYSSLAYLKLLPIQTLKLDRTFVSNIESDANDAAISAASVALAHQLGLEVVAEGVETEGQLRFLKEHGCEYLQGFLMGRPERAKIWSERWQVQREEAKRIMEHKAVGAN